MRVTAIGCTLAAALLACRALAGDFEDGMTAYKNKDYAGALTLLRRAADQGVASAQFNLGVMYLAGQGVTRDDKQAVSWFRKGAAQGHASSQLHYYNTLADLIAGLLQVIGGTRRDFLRRLLPMDRSEMSGSSHRARSYFASTRDEFARYNDCREFSDKCWFLTKIGKRDTVPMVRIICRAADISYEDTSALTF